MDTNDVVYLREQHHSVVERKADHCKAAYGFDEERASCVAADVIPSPCGPPDVVSSFLLSSERCKPSSENVGDACEAVQSQATTTIRRKHLSVAVAPPAQVFFFFFLIPTKFKDLLFIILYFITMSGVTMLLVVPESAQSVDGFEFGRRSSFSWIVWAFGCCGCRKVLGAPEMAAPGRSRLG